MMPNSLLVTRQIDQPQGIQILCCASLLKKLFNELLALETVMCLEGVPNGRLLLNGYRFYGSAKTEEGIRRNYRSCRDAGLTTVEARVI